MTEIGGQRQHVFCDVIAVIRASFEGSHGECVAQRVRRGARLPQHTLQPDFVNRTPECCSNVSKKQWFSSQRNKYVVIEGGIWAAMFKVTF
jgi:hypothetical protein